MPLKKILFRPGVNRENTRYASEALGSSSSGVMNTGGWYESDKVRFRQGTPEKIGGWAPLSLNTYLGVCRSLWSWTTLGSQTLLGLGTNLKFYIESGGAYNDITPLDFTHSLATNPFQTTISSTLVTVTDASSGFGAGNFVTFAGATAVGGLTLNGEYQIVSVLSPTTYTINAASAATSTATGGGSSVTAYYQIPTGTEYVTPLIGWGAGGWGTGTWGNGVQSSKQLRIWSQMNFGENLIFGPRGGGIYYWIAGNGLSSRGVNITSLLGADSDTPVVQNYTFVSDASRFVFAFGTNDYGSVIQDPMLIRWSDQESVTTWTPAATNQAGSLRLSHGSQIITCLQTRQEIVVWTDAAVYSLQYVGAPAVWSSTLLGDNISIMGQNAAATASGKVYWMGVDKFYMYDGRVQTLRCDLRQYIYDDINLLQKEQAFASTNEGFNEIWFFYCSANSTSIDKYVIYNYAEDVWYYGSMNRTAWLDSGLIDTPIAAIYNPATTLGRVLNHETGNDDNTDGTPVAMTSLITSTEFDIDDGHNFGFVYRILPDLTFRGSTGSVTPQVTMTLIPLANSGSGYSNPASEGGVNTATIQRIASAPVEQFTGQVFIRVRGRQMVFRIDCNTIGTQWQLGAPRIDIRSDGRRGNG
jgi:hypothetical protein